MTAVIASCDISKTILLVFSSYCFDLMLEIQHVLQAFVLLLCIRNVYDYSIRLFESQYLASDLVEGGLQKQGS